jgi:hypothetical protein
VSLSTPVEVKEEHNNSSLDNVWMVHAGGSCFSRNKHQVIQFFFEYMGNLCNYHSINFLSLYYKTIIYLYLSKLFEFVIKKNENNL